MITNKPDKYSFVGNLKKIEITSSSPVSFTLKCNEVRIVETMYEPSSGKVMIDISKIVADYLSDSVLFPGAERFTISNLVKFTMIVNSGNSYEFYVINGGVDACITQEWFSANFLTWQPQTNYVQWNQPNWLSYLALIDCNIFIKGYFSDGSTSEINLGSLIKDKINTINLEYSTIPILFNNKQPQYVDVYTKSGSTKLSYTQRFVLRGKVNTDDYFVFQNSLSGWDCICFTGKRINQGEFDSKTAILSDVTKEYAIEVKQKYQKNTGYFINNIAAKWSLEFFRSIKKYWINNGIAELIVVEKTTNQVVEDEPSNFTFNFYSGKQNVYCNISRSEYPDLPLEILDPSDNLFFFSSPIV